MSVNTDLVSTLNSVTMQINRYGPAFILLFGTVGNLLNVCVLTEHTLRLNPCSIYLRWSSISSTVFIWSGMLVRVLQGYGINWPNKNNPSCKIRLYFLNVSWAMGMWCLVGANMDRFLCSSPSATYRQWSSSRIARRFVIGNFILFGLLFIEGIYCFEASVPNLPTACNGRDAVCRYVNDWLSLLFDIILPSLFLAIFGLLTIQNIRSRAVHPVGNSVNLNDPNNNKTQKRSNDRNLTRMLLIQVLVVLLLDLPFGIYRAYVSITSNISKSTKRLTVENLIYAVIILFCFFTHSTSFYLYTLTGSLYRAAFKRIVLHCFNRTYREH